MGLPKVHRLKHWRDFQSVYEKGDRYSGRYLTLRVLPDSSPSGESSPPPLRIGIAIGKKVSKKATQRNRIKRQLRSAMRELLPNLSRGWKLVISAKPAAIECKYEHFLRELKQLLMKAEVWNGH